METAIGMTAFVALSIVTALVLRWDMRNPRAGTRGIERHAPDQVTGISDAEWDHAIK